MYINNQRRLGVFMMGFEQCKQDMQTELLVFINVCGFMEPAKPCFLEVQSEGADPRGHGL